MYNLEQPQHAEHAQHLIVVVHLSSGKRKRPEVGRDREQVDDGVEREHEAEGRLPAPVRELGVLGGRAKAQEVLRRERVHAHLLHTRQHPPILLVHRGYRLEGRLGQACEDEQELHRLEPPAQPRLALQEGVDLSGQGRAKIPLDGDLLHLLLLLVSTVLLTHPICEAIAEDADGNGKSSDSNDPHDAADDLASWCQQHHD